MVDTNPNSFDATFLLKGLTSFFSSVNKSDREVLATIFEQLFRSLDDAHHELNQVNRSKDFLDVQTYLQRDWLLRDLTKAEYIGTPHGHFDLEFVAVGGETSFAISRPLDVGATTLLFYNGVQLPQGQGWSFDITDPLLPTIELSFPAAASDVIRLYAADVDALALFTANGIQTVFAFPESINVEQVKIYHGNIELTGANIIVRTREVLFTGGLSSGDIVQFRRGAQLHNVVAAAGQTRVACPFDIDDSTIIRLGGINIRDGWVISTASVSFKTAPRAGVIIRIQAPKISPHDHEVHYELSTLGQTVITTPTELGLDPGFVYNNDRPILLVMNGVVVDTSLYTFTGVDEITMVVPLLGGEHIQVYYHNTTDFSHAHPEAELTLVEPLAVGTGVPFSFLESDKPALVIVNGNILREGTGTDAYQVQGSTIRFGLALPVGTVIFVRAEKFQWTYRVSTPEWNPEIVWVASIQDGVDAPTITLLPNTDFIIYEGALYLNQVFEKGWLKDVKIDLQTPYNNFGYLIDFRMPNSPTYVDLLKSLWAAYVGGPRHYVMQNFGRIMLGAPPAQYAGIVQAVSTVGSTSTVDILGDDGVMRRFTVSNMPVAVAPQERVDRFTALGAGLNVIDHITEPDWYLRFPLFLYAIERFGSTFEASALLDKGVRSTYRVSAIADYDAATHSIVITPTALDWKLMEDLNGQECRTTIFQGANRFDTRLVPQARNFNNVPAIEDLGWGFRVSFDAAFPFTMPPAAATPTTVEFEFERQRRFDQDFIFDEYVKEHVDPIAEQLYSLLRANLFVVELTQDMHPSQERMELLFTLLERVRAVETNYIVLGELPALSDAMPIDTATEDTPSDAAANFAQIPAFLVYGISAFSIGYYGP